MPTCRIVASKCHIDARSDPSAISVRLREATGIFSRSLSATSPLLHFNWRTLMNPGMRSFAAGTALVATLLAPAFARAADIVDTAVAAGSFNTLVTAVKAAGLVKTLKGKGPYTVFAPNDAAFAKLPPGTVESLLKNKAKLATILKYHVVPGRVNAADVAGKSLQVKTAAGLPVNVNGTFGVRVNDAHVIQPDIQASNGVIHVIDTVLLPPAPAKKH
jgi:uncharacterized surface protein with fasciclin (FAS1) repeats